METISNAASAASKATFGEGSSTNKSGEEPVSGQTGGGTVEKPFDAGNAPGNAPYPRFLSYHPGGYVGRHWKLPRHLDLATSDLVTEVGRSLITRVPKL